MTPEERENPQILGASRKKRIAAGCGLEVVDVNRLLKQFEGMQQIIKQVTGGRKPGFAPAVWDTAAARKREEKVTLYIRCHNPDIYYKTSIHLLHFGGTDKWLRSDRRMGATCPYRVVAAYPRFPRDGRFIEEIGTTISRGSCRD